jgi:hypothetical protein
MEIILVAVGMLVLLSGLDRHRWPSTTRPAPRWTARRPRRITPRRRAPQNTTHPHTLLGLASARRMATAGARWWWE